MRPCCWRGWCQGETHRQENLVDRLNSGARDTMLVSNMSGRVYALGPSSVAFPGGRKLIRSKVAGTKIDLPK